MTEIRTRYTFPPMKLRESTMKLLAVPIVALMTFALPLSADQLVLGAYSHATVDDKEAGIDFEVGGLNFMYANFEGDLFWAIGAGGARGEDELCQLDFCIDFETQSRTLDFSLGFNFNNWLTPFVTVARSTTDIDWGVTGLGLADASDSESSIDAGLWIGRKDLRIQIAALGVDDEYRAVSIGGYTVLNSGLALAGFFSKSIEGEGDATGISVGLGWSF